jgi:hypothetical protein
MAADIVNANHGHRGRDLTVLAHMMCAMLPHPDQIEAEVTRLQGEIDRGDFVDGVDPPPIFPLSLAAADALVSIARLVSRIGGEVWVAAGAAADGEAVARALREAGAGDAYSRAALEKALAAVREALVIEQDGPTASGIVESYAKLPLAMDAETARVVAHRELSRVAAMMGSAESRAEAGRAVATIIRRCQVDSGSESVDLSGLGPAASRIVASAAVGVICAGVGASSLSAIVDSLSKGSASATQRDRSPG